MTTTRLGPYEVLARLASGGMAEIFAARDPSDPEHVLVIKQMLPQFVSKPDYVEMFLDEGRIVSLLRHPNIVRMQTFGFHGEAPFLAMEYLHGVDLRAIMRDGHAHRRLLPLPYVLAIASAVCAGLHAAHEATSLEGHPMEIVHRDISPQNIVVTFDGSVKLIDFGIAKSRSRIHETRAGGLKGKVPYMAPEQIRGTATDRRADIYALGVVLYELVTGRRPYVISKQDAPHGEFSLMMAIVEHRIARPSTLRGDLPESVERIVWRALSSRPAERYQTADHMRQALLAAARELGFSTDMRPLASLLRETFGDQVGRWRQALANDDLATEIASIAQLWSGNQLDFDPEDGSAIEAAEVGATPMVRAPSQGSGPTSVVDVGANPVIARSFDDVTVVSIEGKIDEAFRGAERAASLSGSVVLDLGRVTRISSFGVREWLELQNALEQRSREVVVYLARCSEAFVSQLGMIRAFAGGCQIASFLAPYVCSECSHAFEHVFDCELDAVSLAQPHPPPVPCPLCGVTAQLDDNPAYFAPVRAHIGRPVPVRVRAALDRIGDVGHTGSAVDKHVEGNVTRLRFQRPVDRGYRWDRLLDGLEGDVELDLAEGRLDAAAQAAAVAALRGLGSEVTSVRLFGAPAPLASLLEHEPRCDVRTVLIAGRCAPCGIARSVQIGRSDLRAFEAGGPITALCRRCDTPLTDLWIDLGAGATRAASEPSPIATPAPTTAPTPTAPAIEIAPRGVRRSSVRTVALAAVAAAVVLGYIAYAYTARRSPRATAVERARPEPSVVASVDPVAQGVGYGDDDRALAQARAEACRALITAIEAALPDDARALADPAAADADVVTWFSSRLGSQIAFRRLEATRRPDGSMIARYGIAQHDADLARRFYAARVAGWDAIWVEAPPSRPPGIVVASSATDRWHPGDRLVRIGDRAVTSLDVLTSELARPGPMTLLVERDRTQVPITIGAIP